MARIHHQVLLSHCHAAAPQLKIRLVWFVNVASLQAHLLINYFLCGSCPQQTPRTQLLLLPATAWLWAPTKVKMGPRLQWTTVKMEQRWCPQIPLNLYNAVCLTGVHHKESCSGTWAPQRSSDWWGILRNPSEEQDDICLRKTIISQQWMNLCSAFSFTVIYNYLRVISFPVTKSFTEINTLRSAAVMNGTK